MIAVSNLKLRPGEPEDRLLELAAKALRVAPGQIRALKIRKKSLDARKKDDLKWIYTVAVAVDGNEAALLRRCKTASAETPYHYDIPSISPPRTRPVVVGFGPAGMFAALVLAMAGARPIVLERGQDADTRTAQVEAFRAGGPFDPENNVQFGEGGAGTFSDGKLTTNISDPRCAHVLRLFYEAGAPEEILWQAKPHLGTDRLPGIIRNLRARIERAGGEVRFHTKLTDLLLENGVVHGIVCEKAGNRAEIETDRLILAAGHSARDLFALLEKRGAAMSRKPFSLGVRIEHPQALVNLAQYGSAHTPGLGAADYKLSCHLPSGRSVYTFCMCPGGEVVAAASEENSVVVNGMSRFARDGENANSAFLVGVEPADFGGEGVLAGVEFQRRWERAAFALAGGDYRAPAQLLGDFLQGVPSSGAGSVPSSYPLGVTWTDLRTCLPDYVNLSLREAVPLFDRKLHGFARADAVLTGVETRSSSPVRIERGADYQSNLRGVYPCGEGAGYAGGIMSAAVDGLRVAQAIVISENQY